MRTVIAFSKSFSLPIYHNFEFGIVFCTLNVMSDKNGLHFSSDVIGYPVLFVMMLWIVFWVESRFGFNFNKYGIYPQTTKGLVGIITGPFIHGSLKHIFNNSVPLLVLSTALFYFYRGIRWKVLFFGMLLTGVATWIIGRPSLHIGASGVVYMLVAFLFFKGIFSKQFQLTALALVVVFLYGGLLWYVFPIDSKISWEGHLSGFFVGLLFAFVFKGIPLENKKYEWEREDFEPENDPFIKQFDENGNFVGQPKEPIEEPNEDYPKEIIQKSQDSTGQPQIKVIYTLRKNENDAN